MNIQKKSILLIATGLVVVGLYVQYKKTIQKENADAMAMCSRRNNYQFSDNDNSNCQCMIDSINAERSFTDAFSLKLGGSKYHYLKCSQDKYTSLYFELGREIAINKHTPDNKIEKFARCFAKNLYAYELKVSRGLNLGSITKLRMINQTENKCINAL